MDFRDFTAGTSASKSAQVADREWWNRSGGECADAVSATLNVLEHAQRTRLQQIVTSARLYGNLPAITAGALTWARTVATQPGLRERLSYNVVQSVIDTIASKIAKNKPKPLFLTSGGNYKQQRKAKKLNQFVEGIFYENKSYDLGVLAFRDGAVWGDGLIHVFERNKRVCFERVPCSEIYVDEVEGYYGTPRQLHRVVQMDRRVLKALSPKGKGKAIEEASKATEPLSQSPNIADPILVRESWRLPSGENTGDGRHVITINGETLLDEKWEHEWFPFARFQYCPKLYGYWAQGLAEQLMPTQIEINKLLYSLQRSYQLAGQFKVLVENGSKVVKSHLDNDAGTIITYTGTPPQYVVPPIVQPELYDHLERLKASAYEQAGVSQLSANSEKPAGLNSGKALREYNDIESDRFQTIGHAWEAFFLDLADKAISVAQDIAESNGGSYPVKVPARARTFEVDWKDIDLSREDYVMQCFPVSSLPNEPAGRFQTVQEWVQAGWYTVRQGKKLMNFPDLESVDSLEQAAEDYLTRVLDDIADNGEYVPPEPFDDLDLGYELALEYYQHGKVNDLEPERLEMLRRFMGQIESFKEEAAAKAQAEAAAMGAPAGPAGQPQSPPVPPQPNELVQNAPGAA